MSNNKVSIDLSLVDNLTKDWEKMMSKLKKDLGDIKKANNNIVPDDVQISKAKAAFNRVADIAKSARKGIEKELSKPLDFSILAKDAAKVAAVALPFKKMVKTYAEYEKNISSIMMTIPNADANMRKTIEGNINHLAQSVAKSVPDITHGYKSILQGTSDITDMKKRFEETGKIALLVEKSAQSYGLSAEYVGNSIMKLRANSQEFRNDIGGLENYLNKFAIASHDTGVSFEDMVAQIKDANIAAAAGIKENDFLALSAKMVQGMGVGSGAEASTMIRNFVQQMIQPLKSGELTKDMKLGLNLIGIDGSKASALVKKDANQFIKFFMQQLNDPKNAENVGGALSKIFTVYTRGSVQTLAKMYSGVESLTRSFEDQTRLATELNHAYAISSDNLESMGIKLGNSMDIFYEKFITPLKPFLADLVQGLQKAFEHAGNLAEKFPQITKMIALVVGGITTLRLGILAINFLSWVTGLKSSLWFLTSMRGIILTLTGLAGTFGTVLNLALGPIAIAALAAGGMVLAFQKLNTIIDETTGKSISSWIVDDTKAALLGIKYLFDEFVAWISNLSIFKTIGSFIDKMKPSSLDFGVDKTTLQSPEIQEKVIGKSKQLELSKQFWMGEFAKQDADSTTKSKVTENMQKINSQDVNLNIKVDQDGRVKDVKSSDTLSKSGNVKTKVKYDNSYSLSNGMMVVDY